MTGPSALIEASGRCQRSLCSARGMSSGGRCAVSRCSRWKVTFLRRACVSIMVARDNLQIFEQLQPGDRVELTHEVKVGFRQWTSVTQGTVIRTERRRHGLHHDRNRDDKVFSDVIVLSGDDGSRTTVTLDEFTELKKLTGESS